ncbi:beta strand repeat-containing protein [Joostella sp. CR20]|uniref:beta strand repeat-containing protein n=1 Tax=Joostella sp. CR20 TaxID=2804312 RepID=UPI00313C5A21
MVKRILLIAIVFFAFAYNAEAQVGIGTLSPNNAAQLDVVANDKGMLIPRIALLGTDDAQTITAGNVNGLLVYNISNNANITPGFYYWQTDSWKKVISSSDLDDVGGGNVIYNPTNNTFNYIDDSGNQQTINFDEIVKANETETTLVDNGDGSYTYTNEKNVPTTIKVTQTGSGDPNDNGTGGAPGNIYVDESTGDVYTYNSTTNTWEQANPDETVTTFTDNQDGTYTYVSEDGTSTDISVTQTGTGAPTGNGNAGDIYVDESTGDVYTYNSTTNTWEKANAETVSTLDENTDGTYTYTDEDGKETNLKVTQSGSGNPNDNGTGGAPGNIYVDESTGDVYTYNSTTNTWEQANPDETVTTFTDNQDGTYTYISEDGTPTDISVTQTGTGAPTGNGNAGDIYVDESTGDVYTYNSTTNTWEQANPDETVTTLVNNGSGNYTYTSEDGTAETIDVIADVTTNATTIFGNTEVINEISNIVDAEETVTSLSLVAEATGGKLVYTDEDNADNEILLSSLLSTETPNGITLGTDGLLHVPPPAGETTTFFVQDLGTGVITYTDEDSADFTASVTSTDTGNLLTSGADGGSFIDETAVQSAETNTSISISSGVLLYENEDYLLNPNPNVNLISADADNSIVPGLDGGLFVNVVEEVTNNATTIFENTDVVNEINTIVDDAETNTTLEQNLTTGTLTYTNEDAGATPVEVQVTSADADNILTTGADGGSKLTASDVQASETNTSLSLASGSLTYVNEDSTNPNPVVNLISADADNSITASTNDEGLFVNVVEEVTNNATTIFENTDVVNEINTIVDDAETNTTLEQNLTTGTLTYTNEDAGATPVEVQVTSADADNILTTGADGGSKLTASDVQASETNTSLSLASGSLTYVNEDSTNPNPVVNLISADADNSITASTNDEGLFVNVVEEVTNNATTIFENTDVVNEINTIVDDAETNTTLEQNLTTGTLTYTNEDAGATPVEVQVTSADADNILTTGADGGSKLTASDVQASETNTSLSLASGSLTYVNEDSTNPNPVVNLISADADNSITASTNDEGLFVNVVEEVTNNATTIFENTDVVNEINTIVDDAETNTTLEQNLTTGTLTYTNEDAGATPVEVQVTSADADNILTTGADGGSKLTASDVQASETNTSLSLASGSLTYVNEDSTNPNPVVNLISADADNSITASTNDEGLFVNVVEEVTNNATTIFENTDVVNEINTIVDDAETNTTLEQNLTTGTLTYTNEDAGATPVEVQVTSADADNILTTGADGGSKLTASDVQASETNTSLSLASGSLTYVNEDSTNPNPVVNLISADADNSITASTNDEGLFVNVVEEVTNNATTIFENTDVVNEINTIVDDAETNTTLEQNLTTGTLTYTNEDAGATPVEVQVTSADADNILTTGADGGSKLTASDVQASETNTSLSLASGSLTYVNEDSTNPNPVVNLISADADNSITASTNDEGLFVNVVEEVTNNATTIFENTDVVNEINTIVDDAETNTTLEQNLTTGTLTYTNEDAGATPVEVQVTSADADNILTTGADGGSKLTASDVQASETNTSLSLASGSLTYVNEDSTNPNPVVNLISADADNSITASTNDEGLFVNVVEEVTNNATTIFENTDVVNEINTIVDDAETNTTLEQNLTTGTLTYTNEDAGATPVEVQVTSADADNILTTGADGGSKLTASDVQASETNTSLSLASGSLTYVNEDSTNPNPVVNLISADADNSITASTNDEGLFVNVVEEVTNNATTIFENTDVVNEINTIVDDAETNTTLEQNLTTGTLTYTNEDAGATPVEVQVTSADADNILTTGADGGSKLTASDVQASETTTLLVQDTDTGIISYLNENSITQPASVTSADADNILTTGTDGGSFLDSIAVQSAQTLTSLKDVVTQETDSLGQVFDKHTLTYTDENGDENPLDITALIKASETLTSLSYEGTTQALIYSDENGDQTEFKLVDLIGEAQTLTTLDVNVDDKTLDYTDEDGVLNALDLSPILQEPWYSVDTNKGATLNTENIYTQGWVGIGFDEPNDASVAPNEKLRVNGAITTVNSYYADYVFEDYFNGFSTIKDDYKFKSLNEVEAFISANKHLPGITPINEILKTEKGYSFNMSELSIQLLEKTEELYLHVIELNKEIESKDAKIDELEAYTKNLNERLEKLEELLKGSN